MWNFVSQVTQYIGARWEHFLIHYVDKKKWILLSNRWQVEWPIVFYFIGKLARSRKHEKKIQNLNTNATLTLTKFCVHIPIIDEVIQTKILCAFMANTFRKSKIYFTEERIVLSRSYISSGGINPQPGLDSSCRETQPAWCHCTPPLYADFHTNAAVV